MARFPPTIEIAQMASTHGTLSHLADAPIHELPDQFTVLATREIKAGKAVGRRRRDDPADKGRSS